MTSIAGSTILITGGTGSFGNRVAAHLLKHRPAEIRIYSRDEKKQWEMAQQFPMFRYVLGDVRDRAQLHQAMQGVHHVFHAAALKHVPSCELYPYEAVKTNVVGSQLVCEVARANRVKTVVALSTDKAVKPVNAMGTTKALMEKIVCSQNALDCSTVFCCVRYGNVMGSRGSVIPLFRKQIADGKPITITVPQMTRFLMVLDQSVDLVLHAMTHARGGEIFVRKAPAATIATLAAALKRKYSPLGDKHPTEIIGARPGEKIHEVLVSENEISRTSELGDYFLIHPEYRVPRGRGHRFLREEYTSENTTRLTAFEDIAALLDAMGPVDLYI